MPSPTATAIVLAAMLPVWSAAATASSPAPKAAQVPPPAQNVEQSVSLAMWNTERERNLRQVLRRARAAHQEALTKVAIGTAAPIDVTVLEKAIAQLEEAVMNFTPIATPLTPQELKSRRAVFGAFLSNLERAELRFTNGLLTTDELASALLRTAQVIEPSIQAPAPTARSHAVHTSPFTFRPEPTPADSSRARELYSLLTGQVSFVHAAQSGFVYITGEVKNPGKYPLGGPTTVLQLLTSAGGLLPSADKHQIVIVSGSLTDKDGKPLTRFINYNDLMNGKNLKENNLELGPGDAVIVRSPGPGYYWQR